MPVSNDILLQVGESYRKLRNTSKFMLGNLNNFNPDKDQIKYEDMPEYDKYMMFKLNEFIKNIKNHI